MTSRFLKQRRGFLRLRNVLSPALPDELMFNGKSREITGAPTEVSPPMTYAYEVTDARGATNSMQFTIEVVSSVSNEREALHATFTLRGNYPKPFTNLTTLMAYVPVRLQSK